MNKDLVNIVLNILENKIYIDNKGGDFNCNVEIYTDNNLLWKIENDNVPEKKARWYKPEKNLMQFNEIKVILFESFIKIDDIDPYGEEDWNNPIIEKNWKLNYKLEEV